LNYKEIKITVEAIVDGRANAQLGFGVQLQHRLNHDVGGRVPQLI